jgi:hypothetical protein
MTDVSFPAVVCDICKGSGQFLSSSGNEDCPCNNIIDLTAPHNIIGNAITRRHNIIDLTAPHNNINNKKVINVVENKKKHRVPRRQCAAHSPHCVACLEPATHIMIPCGHFCICLLCSDQLSTPGCPVCRTPVTQITRVFF